jgi:predicted NAD/FAD-binding protein
VAIVGAGIAGHGAALGLLGAADTDFALFEALDRAGGHANTVDADFGGEGIPVDTGFIVYNELNYPRFTRMLGWLGVQTEMSDMSFALSVNDGACEWRGGGANPLGGLFAQRRHVVSPRHWAFLRGILRFQERARADVARGRLGEETLGTWLDRAKVPAAVRENYVLPVGAAIWSMRLDEMLEFPARAFFDFFENHRLLQWRRPAWRTVAGGSRAYVKAIGRKLGARVRLGAPVARIARHEGGVTVVDAMGAEHAFDAAIVATSAPRALAMLENPTRGERDVLGAFRTSANMIVLHSDASFMPRRRAAWAAWNVQRASDRPDMSLTYWMNRLQNIPDSRPLFATLNPRRAPPRDKTFATIEYEHPLYDGAAFAAQALLPSVQGRDRVWYCGAWTGHGFHEDGLRSGLEAAEAMGGMAPWGAA